MTDADKVGYRRPPKNNQFKKGRVATRSVYRAKFDAKAPSEFSFVRRSRSRRSQELLRIRDGNRTSSITIQEALVKKQTAMALNGNRLAMKNCLDRIHEAERNKRGGA